MSFFFLPKRNYFIKNLNTPQKNYDNYAKIVANERITNTHDSTTCFYVKEY